MDFSCPAFLFLKGAGSAEAGPAFPLFKVAGSAEADKEGSAPFKNRKTGKRKRCPKGR